MRRTMDLPSGMLEATWRLVGTVNAAPIWGERSGAFRFIGAIWDCRYNPDGSQFLRMHMDFEPAPLYTRAADWSLLESSCPVKES